MDVKKLLYGTGMTGALVGVLLAGGVAAHPAVAQTVSLTATTLSSRQAQPSAKDGEQDDAAEQANQAALQSQAKISPEQARQTALAQVPGSTFRKLELEKENGTFAYSVDLTDGAGKKHEVKVDAISGKALTSQVDDEQSDGDGGTNDD